MSKEPRVSDRKALVAAGVMAAPGAPYGRAPGSLLRPAGPPRLTIHNFPTFRARVKKMPPDANTKAAPNTKLFQFQERVCFGCAKCRRDNIQSDCVALDHPNKIILCTACFTRIVRPRTYRPSRVVPFPSLLSWLNYQPAKATEVSDDIMNRPAEAVAPSGDRMSLPMLANGDQPTSLQNLPAIAMRMQAAQAGSSSGAGQHLGTALPQPLAGGVDDKHPCVRVWGQCQHGSTCLFRNAPADLCIAYLMGLCSHGDAENSDSNNNAAESAGSSCQLLHQHIYDLPPSLEDRPAVRYSGDLEDAESGWARWVQARKASLNSAEWQLWNNGPLGQLFDVYQPVTAKEEEAEAEGAEVKLNLTDIMSALRGIKK